MSDIVKSMIADRRRLHARPEEGWCEFETTYLIVDRLRTLGFEVWTGDRAVDPEHALGRDSKLVEDAAARASAHGVPQSFLDETKGYTGAVGVWKTGRPGPVTALRFDIDALPNTKLVGADTDPKFPAFHTPAVTTVIRPSVSASPPGWRRMQTSSAAPSNFFSSRQKRAFAVRPP